MSNFGAKSTADEVLDGVDLTDKTVFITGGASGLGQETARAMAARGAHVILAARDQAKLDKAADTIRADTGSNAVDTIAVDLASLESVRACGEEARLRFDKIDLLINNAGVMACPLGETADGFEMQFGTNHLGHFVLTKSLMPLLDKGANKRIVNLSSAGHKISGVDFEDPNYRSRAYEKWASYGQSKSANILFSVALQKRLAVKGYDVFAVHPGGIMTNLGRHLDEADVQSLTRQMEERPTFQWKTIPQGAATTCWAATASDVTGKGGVYCEDCHIAEIDDEAVEGGVRSYACDAGNAERLWELSEELVGEKFTV